MEISDFDEIALKKKFAYELLKAPKDSLKIARELLTTPNDISNIYNVGKALKISQLWPVDPVVIAEKEKLLRDNGAKHFLPSKEEFAREVLDVARSAGDFDTKHKFFKLYAESQGFIEKPTTNITSNTQNISNRVMVMPAPTEDSHWEKQLLVQQQSLINDAKTID